MNPDVSLAETDVLKRPLFRDDDKLLTKVKSEEFQELLRTDPTTVDGEAKVVKYFDIADEWANVKEKRTRKGHITDSASTYYYLLMTVKYRSTTDNIWMSFYEGLHRHTALVLSLTSSAFNITKNEIKYNSLTSEFFSQHQIENFKHDTKKPHERLSDIFDGKEKASMLSEQFNIKAIIPKPVKWPITKNSVEDFTNKITKYSELISISKKTSAENSISSLLSKTLLNDQQMSNPEKRNQTTSRPNLFHTYRIQGQVKKDVHAKKMKQKDNDDYQIYQYCELLNNEKWDKFIDDPLNEKAKRDFLDFMTKRSKYKLSELTEEETKSQINDYPPYAIQWDGMTVDVGGTKNAVRKVDPRFYNGYHMLPSIITMLHAKIKKEIPSKIVSDPTNKAMINFTCRYAFLTRAYNQNSTHISVVDYLPGLNAEYLNMCKGTYQVIPVAVFIMTLYNACFMFQKDKTDNLMIKALERFDLTPNIDDNAFLKTMSEFMIKYSWCDYFIMYPTTKTYLCRNNNIFMTLDRIDCISWFHLNASYVLGNKIAKNRESQFNDLGKPQFFYEVVQSWVSFELVQVLQKFGLNPKFKSNLNTWSKDIHCVVQYMKKSQQQDHEKKRAQVCIDILFQPKKTEHYGSFIRCEHGTKMNFEKMTNFAIPLVILTWHRMIQEYFWKNGDKTFFEYGNYMPRKQRFPKDAIDLYMIDGVGQETNIKSFDMIRPTAAADVSQHACLSLLEWAYYLLEPHEGVDKNDDRILNNDKNLKRPMISYRITDDEINWKKESNIDTAGTNGTASVTEEDKLLSKYDWNGENKTSAALIHNIADALKLSHSRYSKLKKLNNTQQEERNIIELGMLSIMQMHFNATDTNMKKNWKDTFSEIESVYQEQIDTEMIEPEQKRKYDIEEIDNEDDDDDSDDDDESFIDPNKQRNLFGDDEDSDDSDTENTLGKESGHKNILGNDSQDAVATDNETTESGKAATIGVSNIEHRKEYEEEPSGKATGNDKTDHDSATAKRIWDNDEEDDYDPEIYSGKKKSIDVSNMEHEEEYEEEPSGKATGNDKTDHDSATAKKKKKRKRL